LPPLKTLANARVFLINSFSGTTRGRIKNKSCGLSKYIGQSVQEKFDIFHSPELRPKGFNFCIK